MLGRATKARPTSSGNLRLLWVVHGESPPCDRSSDDDDGVRAKLHSRCKAEYSPRHQTRTMHARIRGGAAEIGGSPIEFEAEGRHRPTVPQCWVGWTKLRRIA
jgi:hypothetical protein